MQAIQDIFVSYPSNNDDLSINEFAQRVMTRLKDAAQRIEDLSLNDTAPEHLKNPITIEYDGEKTKMVFKINLALKLTRLMKLESIKR